MSSPSATRLIIPASTDRPTQPENTGTTQEGAASCASEAARSEETLDQESSHSSSSTPLIRSPRYRGYVALTNNNNKIILCSVSQLPAFSVAFRNACRARFRSRLPFNSAILALDILYV